VRFGQTCGGVVGGGSDNDDDGPGGVRCDHRRAAYAAARRAGTAVAIAMVVVNAHRVSCPPYTSVSRLFTLGYSSSSSSSYPNNSGPSPMQSKYYYIAYTCL
jgi:hypothetical protein